MGELERKISRVRERSQVDWRPERAERVLAGALAYRRRRRVMRASALCASALTVALAVVGWRAHSLSVAAHITPDSTLVRFADGSTARPLSAGTVINEVARNHVELSRGGARFSVIHDPTRRFVIEAGAVTIQVLGTEFSVQRAADRVLVSVERGRVRVQDENGEVVLTDGERETFPRPNVPMMAPSPAPGPSAPTQPAIAPKLRHEANVRKANAERSTWQVLARDGEFDHAYEELSLHPVTPRDNAVELLLAADVARLSHHPAKAVSPLQTVLDRYPSDPRAPLAAFTLGRVLLDAPADPARATRAFERALHLGLPAGLSADAIALCREALAHAGQSATSDLPHDRCR